MHKKIFSLILVLALCMGVAGCSENDEKKDLWSDAVYTKDTSLGEGEKTIEVKVIA